MLERQHIRSAIGDGAPRGCVNQEDMLRRGALGDG